MEALSATEQSIKSDIAKAVQAAKVAWPVNDTKCFAQNLWTIFFFKQFTKLNYNNFFDGKN